MNYVEPLKNKEEIKILDSYFKQQNSRNHLLFNLGINTPMRVNQLVKLKVHDVLDKEEITVTVGRKVISFPLGKKLQKLIKDYCLDKETNDFLFKSFRLKRGYKPLTENYVNKIIKNASRECNINNIGASSLRKTFAYFYYERTKDIRSLMKLLNHHDQYFTLQYIGKNERFYNDNFIEWEEL